MAHGHPAGTTCRLTVVRVTGGARNVGKTTLAVRLIETLSGRGWRVAAIKRSHHGLPADRVDSDSERMTRAGAEATLYVAADGVVERGASELSLATMVARLVGYEFAIVEGYRDEALGARLHLTGAPPAMVSARDASGVEVTQAGADQVSTLADLLESWHVAEPGPPGARS